MKNSLRYRMLLWELIAGQDCGALDDLDLDEMKSRAKDGSLVDFIQAKLGSQADFSTFEPLDWKAISSDFCDLATTVDEGRKFGIEQRGGALLLAYALECAQRYAKEEQTSISPGRG